MSESQKDKEKVESGCFIRRLSEKESAEQFAKAKTEGRKIPIFRLEYEEVKE